VPTSTIEAGVATQIGTDLSAWTESGAVFDQFGKASRGAKHLHYAIGTARTTALEGTALGSGRQRSDHATLMRGRMVVRWAHALTADGQKAAYRTALGEHAKLVRTVKRAATTLSGVDGIVFVESNRRSDAGSGEFLIFDDAFDVYYRDDLSVSP